MATRFYLPSVGPSPVAPAFTHQAAWTEVDGAERRRMSPTKTGTPMTSLALAIGSSAGNAQLFVQFISDPMAAQVLASSMTFKGTVRCLESAVNDNLDAVSCKVVVVDNGGTVLRGALVNLSNYGPVLELDTVLEAKRIADGDTVSGAVSALDGDRLVFEVGLLTTLGGTSITGTMNFGDNSATDLADNETDQTANNPFIEFSQNIVILLQDSQGVETASGLWTPRGEAQPIARGWA